jgi:hypothetical protein
MGVELKVVALTKEDLIADLKQIIEKLEEGYTSGYGWDFTEE